MALEVELKFLDVDHDLLRLRLKEAGALFKARYFEENVVFDDAQRSLRSKNVLVRLRKAQGKIVFTVKHPAEKELVEGAKVREEIETEVANFSTMCASLEALGLFVTCSYQKVREVWSLEECEVCLDQLPFGLFMEIEGKNAKGCAKRLRLNLEEASNDSYHALNRRYRKQKGLAEDESFVFSPEERKRLESELR